MEEKYEKHEKIGEGAAGIVRRATDKKTGRSVAVKRIHLQEDEGIPHSAVREIHILKELASPFIVKVKDVYFKRKNAYIVYEYGIGTLAELIRDRSVELREEHVKQIMIMILKGLHYLHRSFVLHRDIKPENILISPITHHLQHTDFGLARFFGELEHVEYSPQVQTRWYRAPEILFGATEYGTKPDMWSVGCVFAELFLRQPLIQGDTQMDQLSKTFALLGVPSKKSWPDHQFLPEYTHFVGHDVDPKEELTKVLKNTCASELAIDLLSQFLKYNPIERTTTDKALKHEYFKTDPRPCDAKELPLTREMKLREESEKLAVAKEKAGDEMDVE